MTRLGGYWVEEGRVKRFSARQGQEVHHPFRADDLVSPYQMFGLARLVYSPGRVELNWHIDMLDRDNEGAVAAALSDLPAGTVVRLTFCKLGWASETFDDVGTALNRFVDLQSWRGRDDEIPSCRVEQRKVAEVERSEALLIAAWCAWRQADPLNLMASLGLLRQVVMTRRRGRDDALRYESIGRYADFRRAFGSPWCDAIIGQTSDVSLADPAADSELSAAYRLALDAGEPVLQHALVLFHAAQPVWRGWQRLLLPLSSVDGSQRALSFARITPAVQIPFLGSCPADRLGSTRPCPRASPSGRPGQST